MKKQISRFSVFQSSKVIAILSCIISALITVPLGIYSLVYGNKEEAAELFLQPLVHLAVSFLTALIVFFLYNQIAKVFGGIELFTAEFETPPH